MSGGYSSMLLKEEKKINRRKRIQNFLLILVFPAGTAVLIGQLIFSMTSGLVSRLIIGNKKGKCTIGNCCDCQPCQSGEECRCNCNRDSFGGSFHSFNPITKEERNDMQLKIIKWLFKSRKKNEND